jgi:hypothetical protein
MKTPAKKKDPRGPGDPLGRRSSLRIGNVREGLRRACAPACAVGEVPEACAPACAP